MFGTMDIMMSKMDIILILMKLMFGSGRGAWRRLHSQKKVIKSQ